MKHFIVLLGLFLSPFILCSQSNLSSELEEFSTLRVSGNINLEILMANSGHLDFEMESQPDQVDVELLDNELKIKGKTELGNEPALNLTLYFNESLTDMVSSKGARIISKDTIHGASLALKATSGGKMELVVALQSLDVTISQGSDIILYGKTSSQNVQVSSWGNYLAYELESEDSYIKASSKSQAKVVARRIINATSNGKSFVGYIGEPESTYVKTSLGGEVASFKTKEIALDSD
jgi:hypothetical protein